MKINDNDRQCSWWVYLLRCGDGTFYTGITTDLLRRLAEHGGGRGARYTRGRLPVRLVWHLACASRAEAAAAEYRVRRLRAAEKEEMASAFAGKEEGAVSSWRPGDSES